jgi:uncharacterized protein YjbI with pentapeptide repeats
VTYTATISPSAAGTVTFADGANTIPGCGNLHISADGTSQCHVSYAQSGAHAITAVYRPDAGRTGRARLSLVVGETIANCGHTYQGCNLSGAYLQNADLRGDDLRGGNLQNANLAGADLADASLQGANLQGASLSGTDLAGADLQGANVQRTNLTGAVLTGANLTGANLKGAKLDGADLGGVTWSNTICPDGAKTSKAGGTCQNDL